MIVFLAVDFLRSELNNYLRVKLANPIGEFVVAGNVSSLADANALNAAGLNDRVIISLVNAEEDRISKNPENIVRIPAGAVYKNPKVFLNLYILFAAHWNDYNEALKSLSYVFQFFQYHNVFDSTNSPGLPVQIEKLVPDLVTLSYEQLNQVWSVLGGKYIPSALYKIRMITIEEEDPGIEAPLITQIRIDDHLKFQQ